MIPLGKEKDTAWGLKSAYDLRQQHVFICSSKVIRGASVRRRKLLIEKTLVYMDNC